MMPTSHQRVAVHPRAGSWIGWLASALLIALACCNLAVAGEYPERAIRLVVPFPAGGGADTLARLIMPKVAQILGQSIYIDNRQGAGGNVGAEIVARAEPDGYTLLYGTNGTHSINQALYGNLRFDPIRDFAPVSRMTQIALLLVVNPDFPAHSVMDLIRYAKENPGKVHFASAGNGTTSHLAGELFKTTAGVDIVHVPYRGGALAITDVVGGQVQMMIEVMPNAQPLAMSGKLRGIAVTTAQRVAAAPNYPTFAESGVPGFEVAAWDGILAPAKTPPAIVDKLNAAIRQALDDREIADALRARGAEPVATTPEAFGRHIATSTEKWARVVRESGAKVD